MLDTKLPTDMHHGIVAEIVDETTRGTRSWMDRMALKIAWRRMIVTATAEEAEVCTAIPW